MLDRRVQRDIQQGRIYTIAGGAPNQALVCLVSDVTWVALAERDPVNGELIYSKYWKMVPQAIAPVRAWFSAQDHAALRQWIAGDLGAWRSGHARRTDAPVLIALDTSQAPAATDTLRDMAVKPVRLVGYHLTAGEDNPQGSGRYVHSYSRVVGARFLVDWFNQHISKEKPTETLHGLPYDRDRIIMDFANFEDRDPPGLTRQEILSSASSAEKLRKSAVKTADTETLVDLTADEVVATTLMLTLLAAAHNSPGTGYHPSDGGSRFAPIDYSAEDRYII